MLVTFDVPFEPEATELAIDAAVESGQRLIIVNAAEVPLWPISLSMGYEYVGTDEVEDALRCPRGAGTVAGRRGRAPAALQPRPIEALLELVPSARPDSVRRPRPRTDEEAHLHEAVQADPRARGLPRWLPA